MTVVVPASIAALPYDGVPRDVVAPVYNMAVRLRFSRPKPERIISKTKTQLDYDIVSAIIEAALRVLPPDNTPEGIASRRTRDAEKARHADAAEKTFVESVLEIDTSLLNQSQQLTRYKATVDETGLVDTVKVTPDILFSKPTNVCGVLCHWIEYKNTFGFRKSPFVAKKNKKQFQRYATALGSGMVVYKLGYETQHVQIDGVHCFREAEVMGWLQDTIARGGAVGVHDAVRVP